MADALQPGILFICIGNSCRSPMAEAICRQLVGDRIAVFSAGVAPVGDIAGGTREVLAEYGISTKELRSKHVSEIPPELVSIAVSLDSGFTVERVLGTDAPTRCENWNVPDPIGGSSEGYEQTYELLREKVEDLLRREKLL